MDRRRPSNKFQSPYNQKITKAKVQRSLTGLQTSNPKAKKPHKTSSLPSPARNAASELRQLDIAAAHQLTSYQLAKGRIDSIVTRVEKYKRKRLASSKPCFNPGVGSRAVIGPAPGEVRSRQQGTRGVSSKSLLASGLTKAKHKLSPLRNSTANGETREPNHVQTPVSIKKSGTRNVTKKHIELKKYIREHADQSYKFEQDFLVSKLERSASQLVSAHRSSSKCSTSKETLRHGVKNRSPKIKEVKKIYKSPSQKVASQWHSNLVLSTYAATKGMPKAHRYPSQKSGRQSSVSKSSRQGPALDSSYLKVVKANAVEYFTDLSYESRNAVTKLSNTPLRKFDTQELQQPNAATKTNRATMHDNPKKSSTRATTGSEKATEKVHRPPKKPDITVDCPRADPAMTIDTTVDRSDVLDLGQLREKFTFWVEKPSSSPANVALLNDVASDTKPPYIPISQTVVKTSPSPSEVTKHGCGVEVSAASLKMAKFPKSENEKIVGKAEVLRSFSTTPAYSKASHVEILSKEIVADDIVDDNAPGMLTLDDEISTSVSSETKKLFTQKITCKHESFGSKTVMLNSAASAVEQGSKPMVVAKFSTVAADARPNLKNTDTCPGFSPAASRVSKLLSEQHTPTSDASCVSTITISYDDRCMKLSNETSTLLAKERDVEHNHVKIKFEQNKEVDTSPQPSNTGDYDISKGANACNAVGIALGEDAWTRNLDHSTGSICKEDLGVKTTKADLQLLSSSNVNSIVDQSVRLTNAVLDVSISDSSDSDTVGPDPNWKVADMSSGKNASAEDRTSSISLGVSTASGAHTDQSWTREEGTKDAEATDTGHTLSGIDIHTLKESQIHLNNQSSSSETTNSHQDHQVTNKPYILNTAIFCSPEVEDKGRILATAKLDHSSKIVDMGNTVNREGLDKGNIGRKSQISPVVDFSRTYRIPERTEKCPIQTVKQRCHVINESKEVGSIVKDYCRISKNTNVGQRKDVVDIDHIPDIRKSHARETKKDDILIGAKECQINRYIFRDWPKASRDQKATEEVCQGWDQAAKSKETCYTSERVDESPRQRMMEKCNITNEVRGCTASVRVSDKDHILKNEVKSHSPKVMIDSNHISTKTDADQSHKVLEFDHLMNSIIEHQGTRNVESDHIERKMEMHQDIEFTDTYDHSEKTEESQVRRVSDSFHFMNEVKQEDASRRHMSKKTDVSTPNCRKAPNTSKIENVYMLNRAAGCQATGMKDAVYSSDRVEKCQNDKVTVRSHLPNKEKYRQPEMVMEKSLTPTRSIADQSIKIPEDNCVVNSLESHSTRKIETICLEKKIAMHNLKRLTDTYYCTSKETEENRMQVVSLDHHRTDGTRGDKTRLTDNDDFSATVRDHQSKDVIAMGHIPSRRECQDTRETQKIHISSETEVCRASETTDTDCFSGLADESRSKELVTNRQYVTDKEKPVNVSCERTPDESEVSKQSVANRSSQLAYGNPISRKTIYCHANQTVVEGQRPVYNADNTVAQEGEAISAIPGMHQNILFGSQIKPSKHPQHIKCDSQKLLSNMTNIPLLDGLKSPIDDLRQARRENRYTSPVVASSLQTGMAGDSHSVRPLFIDGPELPIVSSIANEVTPEAVSGSLLKSGICTLSSANMKLPAATVPKIIRPPVRYIPKNAVNMRNLQYIKSSAGSPKNVADCSDVQTSETRYFPTPDAHLEGTRCSATSHDRAASVDNRTVALNSIPTTSIESIDDEHRTMHQKSSSLWPDEILSAPPRTATPGIEAFVDSEGRAAKNDIIAVYSPRSSDNISLQKPKNSCKYLNVDDHALEEIMLAAKHADTAVSRAKYCNLRWKSINDGQLPTLPTVDVGESDDFEEVD